MKRLLLVAAALLCAVPAFAQTVTVTATIPSGYAGATISATSLINSGHSASATVGTGGTVALSLYPSESYSFAVTSPSASFPAFVTGTRAFYPPVTAVDISAFLNRAAAPLLEAVPSNGTGGGLPDPGANGLVTRTGTNATGTFALPVGGATTQLSPLAVLPSADNAQTGGGGNGIANLAAGACASGSAQFGCSFQMSPLYPQTEFSRFFNTAHNRDDYKYQTFPFAGGMSRTRFAEDNRMGNKFWTFINSQPPYVSGQYDNRAPMVMEFRNSSQIGYGDDNEGLYLRQTLAGIGHNYILPFVTEKANHGMLVLNSRVHSSSQGGGMFSSYLVKSAPGDDQVFSAQHDTDGCSESEDECNRLFRTFVETDYARWGGTLNATPTVDGGGIGLYTFRITQTGGYDLSRAGESVPLVNLSTSYAAGNIVSVLSNTTYPSLVKITGDSTAGWLAQFGVSAMTTLAAPIDAKTYNGSCPATVTNSANRTPDPTITNEAGVGGLMGFCATVASSTGITAGRACRIAGPHGNIEDVKIVSQVDATHVTLNAQLYHDTGEVLSCGGAAGYAIRKTDDDIAPSGLSGYIFQNPTTLHKYWPIVGSDSSGALYVYTDSIRGNDMASKGYAYNAPNVAATVTATLVGTAVTTLTVTNPNTADYRTQQANIVPGSQTVLAPPALTITGCTTPPTYTATMGFGGATYNRIPIYTVTGGGNCPSVPTVTPQATYPIPYSINAAAITKKVVDPTNGALENAGYAMTGTIDPTLFPSGATVEMPGWMRDQTWDQQAFGRYKTPVFAGPALQHFFNGAWAQNVGSASSFFGITNNTDGHRYYASASQPVGPGVADLLPPDGYYLGGDSYNAIYVGVPPMNALITVPCLSNSLNSYHPCQDNIPRAYKVFAPSSTSTEIAVLAYDPTPTPQSPYNTPGSFSGPLLYWTSDFAAEYVHANYGFINNLTIPRATVDQIAGQFGNVNFTSPVVLLADPTTALQAATKQYVDAHSGGGTIVAGTVIMANGSTTAATTLSLTGATHPLIVAQADSSSTYPSSPATIGALGACLPVWTGSSGAWTLTVTCQNAAVTTAGIEFTYTQ